MKIILFNKFEILMKCFTSHGILPGHIFSRSSHRHGTWKKQRNIKRRFNKEQ